MSAGLVSVVIPVYNGEKFLAEAIESIRTQTYEPIEIIVADDASTDDSAKVAEAEGVKVVRLEENGGPATARNAGIAASTGEYWTSLDCDDLMRPERIEKQVAEVKDGGEFVLCLEEYQVAEGVPAPDFVTAERVPISAEREQIYHTMSFLAPMEAMRKIGPFEESLRFGEDIDFCLRAFDAGLEVRTIPEELTIRRFHGENITYDMTEVRKAMFAAVRRRVERKRSAASET